jgi:hypothetical protein
VVFMVEKLNWKGNLGAAILAFTEQSIRSAYDFCYSCSMYMSN